MKCSSTGKPSGSDFLVAAPISFFASFGRRRASWYVAICISTFFQRTIAYVALSGSRRSSRASGSRPGIDRMYVGERCSIVTISASRAIAGTRVTAVAPLPITTTFLPA